MCSHTLKVPNPEILLVARTKMQCSRGGNPYANKLRDRDGNYIEGPCRRTTSQRCFCRAQVILKPALVRGFVIMGFEEEHNHPPATARSRMFLRCNRKVSDVYQNFIMECSRANIGPTRAHTLVKEMTGSYEDSPGVKSRSD